MCDTCPITHRLAVLDACSPCHVSRLELRGAVPHSTATAEAVRACCPHLICLDMDHKEFPSRWEEVAPSKEAAAEYHDGCVQLLTLCGPRLTELRLHGVHHWQPLSYMAVRHCTALTALDFKAAFGDDTSGSDDDGDVDSGELGVPCVRREVAFTCRRLAASRPTQLYLMGDDVMATTPVMP